MIKLFPLLFLLLFLASCTDNSRQWMDVSLQYSSGQKESAVEVTCSTRQDCPEAQILLRALDKKDPAVCTKVLGGAGKLEIRGRVGKRKVAEKFTQTDSCQIARWELLAPLLEKIPS